MIPSQDWNKRQGKRQRKVPLERLVAEDGFHFLCHIVTVLSWAWLQRDRQIPTVCDGCFSIRAPRGDLANRLPQPLHSDNRSVPLWALQAASLQRREIVIGGGDGDVHLPSRLTRLPSRSSIQPWWLHPPHTWVRLVWNPASSSPLGQQPCPWKCARGRQEAYLYRVWYWRQLSWSSS